jgi:hypothetical protein
MAKKGMVEREMAEIEAVSKTVSGRQVRRGFKSLPLRLIREAAWLWRFLGAAV